MSSEGIRDDQLARLIALNNVLVTGHQAFFTREALQSIMDVTIQNISEFEKEGSCENEVEASKHTQ